MLHFCVICIALQKKKKGVLKKEEVILKKKKEGTGGRHKKIYKKNTHTQQPTILWNFSKYYY